MGHLIRTTSVAGCIFFLLGWVVVAGLAAPSSAAEDATAFSDLEAYPLVVANFYFAGTFGTGKGWDESYSKPAGIRKEYMPWFTPALWESMWKYPKHSQVVNGENIYTYHRFIPGVAAWQDDAHGDRAHCLNNPRGWEEVHGDTGAGAERYWIEFLEDVYARRDELDLGEDYKIIVNIGGQSRGGMSAIRFAGEIETIDQDMNNWIRPEIFDRIAWINVVATDPVWDENNFSGYNNPCIYGPGPAGVLDYTRWNNYVLGAKVRNYVGIYAEDERSSDFWPVIPHADSVDTNVVILTVPGSHQTLVGNYQSDGHRGKHWYHGRDSQHWWWGPLWDDVFKWSDTPTAAWKSVQYAVTYMVLELWESSDFGFTEFKTGADDGDPNYLRRCRDAIVDDPAYPSDPEESWKAHLQSAMNASRDRIRSVSFLPKGGRGKLMAWVGSSCVEKLSWSQTSIQDFLYEPRCAVKATGEAPTTSNTYGEGLEKGKFTNSFIDDLSSFSGWPPTFTRSPEDRWLLIEPILDSKESYTFTAVASGVGCVLSQTGDQVVPHGGSASLTIDAAVNHIVKWIKIDEGEGLVWNEGETHTFSDVREDHKIEAQCEVLPDFKIKAKAREGGSINPEGPVAVPQQPPQDQTFSIRGNHNNNVDEVWIDEVSTGPLDVNYYQYTFYDVAADHTIEASFVNTWLLLVGVSPYSGGRVVGSVDVTSPPSSPPADGIDCGNDPFLDDCYDLIYPGDAFDLVPTAESGYRFAGWTGCDVTPAPNHADPNSCRMSLGTEPPLESGNQVAVYANFVSEAGGTDPDGDGVPTAVEMAALNSGDGNFDGVPDADQVAVASFESPKTEGYCTVDLLGVHPGKADTLMKLAVKDADAFGGDPNMVYPSGVVSFVATDYHWEEGVGVRFTVHGLVDAPGYGYVFRRLNPLTSAWETVPATITSHPASRGDAYTTFEYEFYPPMGSTDVREVGGPALVDSDGDGIADSMEEREEGTNPSAEDSDGDGLSDAEELALGTSPADEDSNGDGVKDGDQVDPSDPNPDGDEMPSRWELDEGLDPLVDDSLLDPDGDGAANIEEFKRGTRPLVNDLDEDGDGMPTEWEFQYRPTLDYEVDDADEDPDGDGLTNYEEYLVGSDPLDPNSVPVELQKLNID